MAKDSGGIGGWDIKGPSDLRDVTIPESMGRSREVEAGENDKGAQAIAAANLAYSLHGSKCDTCGAATKEADLCNVGVRLYQHMRELGIVP